MAGLQCSHNWSFFRRCKNRIKLILNKAWQRIGILWSLRFVATHLSLEKMYFCLTRPTLEYGDVVKHDIEVVQIEAARIVTGVPKLCNIQSLLADLSGKL